MMNYLMNGSKRQRSTKRPASRSKSHKRSLGRRLQTEHLELRAMLAASWHNPFEASDVDGDGHVSPIDALHVINELNINGPRKIENGFTAHRRGLMLDTYEDGHVSPVDAVTVLNAIGAEGEDHDLVQIRLSVTDTAGNAIDQIDVGQPFVLNALVQDLTGREDGGVFAGYVDITYDSAVVSTTGAIEHGDDYGNGPSGTLTPGLIDEAGSFDGLNELGPSELLLFSIPMNADANGSVTFLPDPADASPAHDVLVFGVTEEGLTNIPTDRIAYVPVTLQVGEVQTVTAASDAYAVDENNVLIVGAEDGVLVNDDNPFGGSLAAALIDDVGHGTLTLNADGAFSYTPDADFVGTDSFTYQASVGGNQSNVATVNITVNAINTVPTAVSDAYLVDEDQVLTTTVSVLANDSDDDGDALTAVLVDGPANGTVDFDSDGQFTYTPDANYFGTDTFIYAANDGTVNSSPTVVTITVDSVNDAPVAQSDAYSVDADGVLTVPLANGTLNNDSDIDGDQLLARIITQPSNGSVTLNDDGSLVYTPDAGFTGTDSFTYVANDGDLDSAAATVSVTVEGETADQVRIRLRPTNLAGNPITSIGPGGSFLLQVFVQDIGTPPRDGVFAAYLDVAYTAALASVNGALDFSDTFPNFVSGDTSVDGVIDELGSFAETTPLGDGEFLLVSVPMRADGVGTISFAGSPADELPSHDILLFGENEPISVDLVDYGTAQLEVVGGDAPVAVSDTYDGTEDETLTVSADDGVLANDVDDDSDVLTAILVDGPANGDLVLNANGSFTYTPDADFNGQDTFTYQANDGAQNSNVATVTLQIAAVDDAPVAFNDRYELDRTGDLVVGALSGVLVNDVDVDGDRLTARLIDEPTNGSITLNANGSFSYTPNAGFVGVDVFTYRAVGAGVASNLAEVSIEVGDTSPSSVAGFVFSDTDNDGVMDPGEARYGGVRIRLQGMDLLGNMIFEEVRTAADGSYGFSNILQGTYTLTEFQPLHLIDGQDRINGGQLSLRNDRYELDLEAGETLTNYNFGERGLEPQFITNPFFFASVERHGLLAMTNGAGELDWYCTDGGWLGVQAVDVLMSTSTQVATVTVTGANGSSDRSNIALNRTRDARIITGTPSNGYLFQLTGTLGSYGLSVDDGPDAEAVDILFGG